MVFAFNPDVGPARIFRYVEPGTLPSRDLVSIYDKSQNLLIIDRVNFARLTDVDRHRVLRTHQPALELSHFGITNPSALAA